MKTPIALGILSAAELALGVGFRTVGSSGCAAQMAFVPPFTDTIVFLDNYHPNYGGPGVNLATGAHSAQEFRDNSTGQWIFGAEYSWKTNQLRKLHTKTNTFCSAGVFLPNGTMVNMAGSEPDEFQANLHVNVMEGFDSIRTYSPGPCQYAGCGMDFVNRSTLLQSKHWYPSAESLINGDILVVGGSSVGLLVLNEAIINVPTYEIIKLDLSKPPAPVELPILKFSAVDNVHANMSYNLYPILILLPNAANANHIFTIAGNQVIIWDYTKDQLIKTLPNTPLQPRNFPSSATVVLLPLVPPLYEPTILMCGGASGDMPNPQTLNDCYTTRPNDLPNGGQVMTDAVLLPDGQVLLINGAQKGCAGGYQADSPVFTPLMYNHSAPTDKRFTAMPKTTIPRLYHSVAQILPSGEVMVAGSNPDVFYSKTGTVPKTYPYFKDNGHYCAIHQQQNRNSSYPTEYKVEIFAPPYMDSNLRPYITAQGSKSFHYGQTYFFDIAIQGVSDLRKEHAVAVRLINPGFRTHGLGMGHRAVELPVSTFDNNTINVTAPPNATVIVPGVYLLYVVVDGIPSDGVWTHLS